MTVPQYSELPRPMERAEAPHNLHVAKQREVIIIGGGIAGLSAAIYLGRSLRDVMVIDAGESLAMWEPEVQNYLGFPDCIDGRDLLKRGKEQALRYGAEFIHEEIEQISRQGEHFRLMGKRSEFLAERLLLATGVYHLPPKIPEVNECTGKSMFFCKDCDGYRVQGKNVVIVGKNNEAVEYALGILTYTECVTLVANGETPRWDSQHDEWLREYHLPVSTEKIVGVEQREGLVSAITLGDGTRIAVDAMFTTRGDVFHNQLARQLEAKLDEEGQVVVDRCQRTSVPGLYAAGCVTPANCQMIIAAGDGAAAAQAINRDLFEKSLRSGKLRRHRQDQLESGKTMPVVLENLPGN